MKIFGHDFKNLDEAHLRDLITIERESATYGDYWIDGLDDFRHARVKLTEAEAAEYVRGMKALDLFLGGTAKWAREVPGIPEDIASRADAYQMHTIGGQTFGPPYHCAAAFMGPELERISCFDHSRRKILEEQGTAAFLSTIRRAVDALTPAIRCFTSRERGLAAWPVAREDDIRDLLYAMLRASISDIKREEPIPRHAGASRVADLHSGLAKTLIEIKWVRKNRWRRILDEIQTDIQTYGRHPDCRYLIFVVVDAEQSIPDPHLVETELDGQQTIDGKHTRVIAYVRQL